METDILGRRALADQLRKVPDMRPALATQLANGDKSPSLDLALRIETAVGIPPQFWKSENRGAAMWARIQEGAK